MAQQLITYFNRFKALLILAVAVLLTASASIFIGDKAEAKTFHTPAERARLHEMLQSLPTDTNLWFGGSGKCAGCHGHDPAGNAFITSTGEDVNIADAWAGTMMANSAKDPFWRAKVSHEILVNPAHQQDIENLCTRCHAPVGRFEAEYTGQMPYSIAAMEQDSLALDGVNCSACHQQFDTLLGRNFSGNLHYKRKQVWGPYTDPFTGPMQFFAGFTPNYGPHVTRGGFCGGCHTLQTNTVDLSGQLTGQVFTEQATYHEWLNSQYSDTAASTARSCQSCHLPRITDPVDIATNYPFLDSRTPFGKHELVGGNAFMLKLMRNNMSAIGATCQPENFDTAIVRTMRMLRDSTVSLTLTEANRTSDTVFFDVRVLNKAGHKFPSGYPARIAWIELVVMDATLDTLFASGLPDGNGDVRDRDLPYEPHYNQITSSSQVQIYEMVLGDVAGNETTVLERADTSLKDNRLPPIGFTTSHSAYDTCLITPDALGDGDFNRIGLTQGTGADEVHYHVPLAGYTGALNVSCRVWYQSVPRRWLGNMFSFSSPQITAFQNMYNAADLAPELVAQVVSGPIITSTQSVAQPQIRMYPNPTANGQVQVSGFVHADLVSIQIFDLTGRLVAQPSVNNFDGTIELPTRGLYLVAIETKKTRVVQKVLWR
jgi:hypothetical protein